MRPNDSTLFVILLAATLLTVTASAKTDDGSDDGNWTVESESYIGFSYDELGSYPLLTSLFLDDCQPDDQNIGGACFAIHVRPSEDIIGNATVIDEDGNPRPFQIVYWDEEEGARNRPERSCGKAALGKHSAHRTIERIYITVDEFPIPGGLCPGALTTNTGTITLEYQIVDVNETFGDGG